MFGIFARLVGTAISVIIRLELSQTGLIIRDRQVYNTIVTAHAFVMIFFFVMPIIIRRFRN